MPVELKILLIVAVGYIIIGHIIHRIIEWREDRRWWKEMDERIERRQREWHEQLMKALWNATPKIIEQLKKQKDATRKNLDKR